MVLETAENVNNGNPSPLEALLAGAEGFPPMLDIPPDADDETMVELAIALSLQQDQQGVHGKIAQLFIFITGRMKCLCANYSENATLNATLK